MIVLWLDLPAPPGLEFLGAERVGDVLYGVAKAVGVVVGRVNAPLVPGPVVVGVLDSGKKGKMVNTIRTRYHGAESIFCAVQRFG